MNSELIEKERELFEAYIRRNWERKHHNFSLKDDGNYFYSTMEDAFMVWLGSKGWEYV
jgi:hypothetical protein